MMRKRLAKKICKADRRRLRAGILSTGGHTKAQIRRAYRRRYPGVPLLWLRFPAIGPIIENNSLKDLRVINDPEDPTWA